MSEFIERVARDLWNAGWATDWEEVDDHTKELTRNQARAAIKAMMEPTSEMLAATMTATPAMVTEDTVDDLQMIRRDYQAMLTAALEESKEG